MLTLRRVGGIWFWRVGPLGGSIYLRRRAAQHRGERLPTTRKTDWFLVIGLLAIAAALSAPIATYELRVGPCAETVALCDTDTDCAERFGGNGDPE